MGKNVIVFGGEMNSTAHIDNKKKNIFIIGEGVTKGLDGTTLIAEAKYPINFSQ